MVHTERPLQEKMALFWHNHFATAYSKVSGNARRGRRHARDGGESRPRRPPAFPASSSSSASSRSATSATLVIAVAKDVAMLVWLDGRTNVKRQPQENFARELMELFTMGVGNYAETDVYAGARVFTGWNLQRVGGNSDAVTTRSSTTRGSTRRRAKEFTFPIYPTAAKTIPARVGGGRHAGRPRSDRRACVSHPATGPRLARKLYAYFVNEVDAARREPDRGHGVGLLPAAASRSSRC